MPNESPNGFTARVYDPLNQEWRPIYQAPDATNVVQGDVYLSDSVSSTLNAATGMTAATPAAVKAANDNANTKIPNTAGSVTNTNLAANSVTSDKIKDGTIVNADIADGTITGGKIADNTITHDKLADNCIESNNIKDGTIVNADIANGTITGSKITNDTITTNHIQDGTITNDDIAPGTIKGDRISNSTISSSHIIDGTIELNDLSKNLQNIIQSAGQTNLTANRAVITNSNGNGFETSGTTSTELSYLSGVTSSVQNQLNNKAALNHTHNYAGASSPGGPATSANRLATARTMQTDLGSESAVSFDGSANITPGVKGTLPIAHGGTGATTARAAEYNIMNQIRTVTSNVADSDMFVCKSTSPDATNGATYARSFSTVYNAIKDKTDDLYLPLTGGVLSGTVRGPGFTVQSSFMNNPGSTPSESQFGNQLIFSTQNNTRIGSIRAVHQAPDGATGIEFNAVREINGTSQFAGMRFTIDASGNYYVTPTNNKFINAFRDGFNITNADIRDFIYPVGSYYISNSSTSPAQRFGGEWLEVGDDNSEQGFFLYAHHGNKTGGTTRHRHIMNTGKAVNDSQYIMDFDNPNTFLASAILGRSEAYAEVTYNGAMQYAGQSKPGPSGFSMETGPGTSKMSRIRLDMTSEPVINVANGGQKEYNYEFLPGQPYESGEVLPPYREVFAWIRTA